MEVSEERRGFLVEDGDEFGGVRSTGSNGIGGGIE
jgi:hypothetical protein